MEELPRAFFLLKLLMTLKSLFPARVLALSTMCQVEKDQETSLKLFKSANFTNFGKVVAAEVKEALSVLMLCAPNNRWRPFTYHTKMADFSREKKIDKNSEKYIEYDK